MLTWIYFLIKLAKKKFNEISKTLNPAGIKVQYILNL